jgi:hypothetical protein
VFKLRCPHGQQWILPAKFLDELKSLPEHKISLAKSLSDVSPWLPEANFPVHSNVSDSNSWVLRLTLGLMMGLSSKVSRTTLQGTWVSIVIEVVSAIALAANYMKQT